MSSSLKQLHLRSFPPIVRSTSNLNQRNALDRRDYLRAQILEVVENQLRDGDPPETSETLARLMKEGHTEDDAKRLIGCVVTAEIFDVLREGRPYDRDRFVTALAALPDLPE